MQDGTDMAAALVSCQGCGIQTVPDLCCPKCSELGRTSFFCGQDCFKTSWKLHSRLHNVIKKSQIANAQRYHPSNASASSFESLPTNNSSTHSNSNTQVFKTTQLTNGYRTGNTDERTAIVGDSASTVSLTGAATTRVNAERTGGAQLSSLAGPHTGAPPTNNALDTSSARRKDDGGYIIRPGTGISSVPVVAGGMDQHKAGPSDIRGGPATKFDSTTGTAVDSFSTGGNRLKSDTENGKDFSYESHKGGTAQNATWSESAHQTATRSTTTSMSVPDRDADWDSGAEPIEVPSTAFGLPSHKFRPVYPNRPNNGVSQNTSVSAGNGTVNNGVSSGGGDTGTASGWLSQYVWGTIANVSRLPRDYEKWRKRKTSYIGQSGRVESGSGASVVEAVVPVGAAPSRGADWAATAGGFSSASLGAADQSGAVVDAERSALQQAMLLAYSAMRLFTEFYVVVATLRNRHDVIGRVKPNADTPTSRRMKMFLIFFRILCVLTAVYILIFKTFRSGGRGPMKPQGSTGGAVFNVLTSNMKKSPGAARGVST